MRQVGSPTQCHERLGKGKESVRQGLPGSFPTHGVADEHDHKINHFVVPHTSACGWYALLDGFLEAQLAEYLRHNGHVSEPPGRGGNGGWGNLDMD
jgi:hypothetical protein